MKSPQWHKIDLAKYEVPTSKLLESGAIEGAYVNEGKSLLFGDFCDEVFIQSGVLVDSHKMRAFCTHCGDGLCLHSAVLIRCFTNFPETFQINSDFEFIADLQRQKGKRLMPEKSRKKPGNISLKAIAAKLTGLKHALNILNELVTLGAKAGKGVASKNLKEQVERLGEFKLKNLELVLNELLKALSIESPDHKFLYRLESVFLIVENSIKEFEVLIKEKSGQLPFSILTGFCGHTWTYNELAQLKAPVKCRLLQLNFSSLENLPAQRLEEVGVWLDLGSGQLIYTQNHRPFKALRHIQETDTEIDLVECADLIEYPGIINKRVRWKVAENRKIETEDIKSAFSLAQEFDSQNQKRVKEVLRDYPYEFSPHLFLNVEEIFLSEEVSFFSSCGEKFFMHECDELRVMNVLDNKKLTNVACLFRFSINWQSERIEARPLCIVTEDQIIRLGF